MTRPYNELCFKHTDTSVFKLVLSVFFVVESRLQFINTVCDCRIFVFVFNLLTVMDPLDDVIIFTI